MTYEIIIVDNETPRLQDSYWSAMSPNIVLIKNSTNKNPYTSRNIGIQHAQGRWIALLDAKCKLSPDWLSHMIQCAGDSEYLVVGKFELEYASEHLRDMVYGILYLNNQKNVSRNYGVTVSNILVHRSVFDVIGVFDENTNSGNDITWSRRALKNGYRISYSPSAIVTYPAQSWTLLSTRIKKYAMGTIAQKEVSVAFYSFLPMRISNFRQALAYRNLGYLSWHKKTLLWLYVWNMKIKYAMNLVKSGSS